MFNVNPRQMQKMMQRMGMQQQEVEASEVIIRTSEKDFVFRQPNVSKVNVMGQETWQIVGKAEERARQSFTDEDVKTVMEQAHVAEERAREALNASKGDLAEAIMGLK